MARAANKAAEAFCRRFGLHLSFRGDINAHGEAGSSAMCQAWMHRMQYYYDIHRLGGEGHKAFTEADH
eukprot:13662885-Alexandrium_andersonii.AAC.1